MAATSQPTEFRLPDDFFPITTWELPPRSAGFGDSSSGLKSVADCGFTAACFVPPTMVSECRKLGLRAIIFGGDEIRRWKDFTDDEIETAVANLVRGTERNDTVLGYFICDEPGVQEFPQLAKAVAAVKRLAPGKLAYINLYPNYATIGNPSFSQLGTPSYAEYLERFITEVKPQLLSYDNYRVQTSRDFADPKGAISYFTNLMQVRDAARKHNLPFWQIVTGNQIRPFAHPPSPANYLLQAYTTLATGAEGLTFFTYYASKYKTAPVDKDGHRTVSWSYLKMANEQVKVIGPIMRRLKNTGVYFTAPPDASLPALPEEMGQSVQSATPLMVGEFADSAGVRHVMLVNLSLDRSSEIHFTPSAPHDRVSQFSPVDGALLPLAKGESFWLTPGQGVLLKVE
jgi:hypothetical protein